MIVHDDSPPLRRVWVDCSCGKGAECPYAVSYDEEDDTKYAGMGYYDPNKPRVGTPNKTIDEIVEEWNPAGVQRHD